MEPVFSRFESYDFEADQRFQEGLKTLNNSGDETKLLDMKLFFYNRFVEPIDRSSYKHQSSASPLALDCPHLNQGSYSDCAVSNNQTAETSAEMEATQLSFAEVMQLIQEGKDVPGVKKLDVKPTNQSPTPSQMERILKPWETSSGSG